MNSDNLMKYSKIKKKTTLARAITLITHRQNRPFSTVTKLIITKIKKIFLNVSQKLLLENLTITDCEYDKQILKLNHWL